MQEWLINVATNHDVLIYGFIIFLAFAEGPFLSLICGVILRLGYLKFLPVYLALMGGDVIGDTLWYFVGFYYGHNFIRKFGKYFNVTEQDIEKVRVAFSKYHSSILFLSKLTNGFGFSFAVLLTAGMSKIPFRRFIAINMLGQFVWTGLLIAVGYFFSHLYIQINDIFGRIFLILIFILVSFVFIRYVKYIKNKYL